MSLPEKPSLAEVVALAHKAGEIKPLTEATLEEVFATAYEKGTFGDIPFARFAISDLSYYPGDRIKNVLSRINHKLVDFGTVDFAPISHMPNPKIDGHFLLMGNEISAVGFLYVNSIETFMADGTPTGRDYLSLASARAFAPFPHAIHNIGNVGRGHISIYSEDCDGSNWSIHIGR